MSTQTLGEAKEGEAWTELTFMDGSSLRVHWDGRHEVAGLYGDFAVTIYQPGGRRLHIPLHRIARIVHQEGTEE